MSGSALVMGGGCAGIAASLRLAEAGWHVTLVETRKRLGGRATSHIDQATGGLIDNCQHVVLGCCTNLIDLYHRLGVADRIAWHRKLYFADKAGKAWAFSDDKLPAPAHLTRALLSYRGLKFGDRLRVAMGMRRIMKLGNTLRHTEPKRTFGDWLREHGQTNAAIERFWQPIVVSACNLPVDRCEASYAVQVFYEGFMAHRDGFVMGVSDVPLAQLYERTEALLNESGGRLMLGTSVSRLHYDGERITGVEVADGQTLAADVVISALPFDRLAKVAPPELCAADERLHGLERIDVSPIVGVHLWFDRHVLDKPHLFFVDSPLDWVFATGRDAHGQYLHAGISAADAWVGETSEAIIAMAERELRGYTSHMPALSDAGLLRGRVIKEKRATFAPTPGIDAHRPAASGGVANLLLAGDWTATGWPATMEGAVRSGYAAAGAAVGRDLRVADLPVSRLVRWIGRLG